MAKSEGKRFEEDFSKSIPEGVYFERRKDDGFGYKGVNNGYDFMVYVYPNLFFFELKSVAGKSVPFNILKEQQINFLEGVQYFRGMFGGFIFNYRGDKKTYFLTGEQVTKYITEAPRKSFPLEWCEKNGLLIPCKKLRTRFRYNIEYLLNKVGGRDD
jgi:recombination protein U